MPNQEIETRGPLPARIYQINRQFYNQILNENINPKTSLSQDKELNNLDIKKGTSLVKQSFEYLGQYDPNKKFKKNQWNISHDGSNKKREINFFLEKL